MSDQSKTSAQFPPFNEPKWEAPSAPNLPTPINNFKWARRSAGRRLNLYGKTADGAQTEFLGTDAHYQTLTDPEKVALNREMSNFILEFKGYFAPAQVKWAENTAKSHNLQTLNIAQATYALSDPLAFQMPERKTLVFAGAALLLVGYLYFESKKQK